MFGQLAVLYVISLPVSQGSLSKLLFLFGAQASVPDCISVYCLGQLAVLCVSILPSGQGSPSKLLVSSQCTSFSPRLYFSLLFGQLAVLCVSILPSGQGSLSKLRVSVMTKLQLLAVWTRSQLVSVGQIVCVYSDQRC